MLRPRWISGGTNKFWLTAEFAGEQRNLHGREVAGSNETTLRHHFVFWILLSLREPQFRLVLRWHPRQRCARSRCFHARDAAQLVESPIDSLREAFPVDGFPVGGADVERQNLARLKTRRDSAERLKTAQQQSSARQQRDGQRYLHPHKRPLQRIAPRHLRAVRLG